MTEFMFALTWQEAWAAGAYSGVQPRNDACLAPAIAAIVVSRRHPRGVFAVGREQVITVQPSVAIMWTRMEGRRKRRIGGVANVACARIDASIAAAASRTLSALRLAWRGRLS